MSDNITLIRYKTHGTRLEIPVWRDKYLDWKKINESVPVPMEHTSVKPRRGKKGSKKHADDEDQDESGCPQLAPEVAASVKQCLFEGKPRIFSNAYKKETFHNRDLLLNAFGTTEVITIAYNILARGSIVETDVDRQNKRCERDFYQQWIWGVLVRMLRNKYTGETPDELPGLKAKLQQPAASKTSMSSQLETFSPLLSVPPKSDVIDAAHRSPRVSSDLSRALVLVQEFETAENVAKALWLVAAHAAQQLCEESKGDLVRNPALTKFSIAKKGSETTENMNVAQAVSLFLYEFEGISFHIPTLDSVNFISHANGTYSFDLLIDETFASIGDGFLVRHFLATTLSDYIVSFQVYPLCDMISDARLIAFLSSQTFEIFDRIVETGKKELLCAPLVENKNSEKDKVVERKKEEIADKKSQEYLNTLSLSKLKEMCKTKNVGQGGKKVDLIARLQAAYAEES